ncbi:HDOD domain-containing protein [Desulfosarcina sp.]|uniref:HDOD domain-containing protein n=1 Tax=Desulfosarcina sp. TaxID=2027861 RepID=UPI0035688667
MVSDDAHFRVYHPGEVLIRQGHSDQSLFIILTGTVKITEGASGTFLAVLQAGDILGEMAFLTHTRRTANVVARESVIALKLDRVIFEQLSPEIREKFKDKIIEKMVARLDAANKEMSRLNAALSAGFPEPLKLVGKRAGMPISDPPEPLYVSGRDLIREIISTPASLPAIPEMLNEVQQIIKKPATSPAQLVNIIENDSAMVAGILKVANSPFYGFRGKVATIQHASALFGTRRLAELITAISAGRVLGKPLDGYGFESGDIWRHSMAVACTTVEMAAAVGLDALDTAYTAGLFHDVGKIILDPYVRERKVLFDNYTATHPRKTLQDAERDILGVDHADIAAILCESWNLPRSVSFGIRHHHQPSSAGDHQLSHILHLADYFTIQAGVGVSGTAFCQELDETSRLLLALDPDTIDAAVEKARQYVESLSGLASIP